ncbi:MULTISPECIES: hypothetical protein [Priestia]|uniref:Uncharacterized protein n=3 Tax=Priestia TaxID=2800373 RepID=A0A806TCU4_PRIMG|nr:MULTISPECIES: hypothetical protein [Priestia]MBK0291642.1 hypothetical protein [Bacillus sp. S34]AKP75710.1 hypothetical protein AS52_00744 [Priestia megaterium Q3]MBY0210426.1 hypothetical protein [Priestia aryabhattai]MCA1048266.1 hypothetical protein [Priestia aryabhattai]MCM2974790.1 hypothetical protein [Priestia aryabhattai]
MMYYHYNYNPNQYPQPLPYHPQPMTKQSVKKGHAIPKPVQYPSPKQGGCGCGSKLPKR